MDIETLTDHIEAIRGTLKIAVADTKAQGLTRTWAQEALPHLEALAAHLSTSNGMTEEEIERISDEQETIAQMAFDPEDITAYTVGFKCGLRYARERGMIAPSNVPVVTVDAIMEVVNAWVTEDKAPDYNATGSVTTVWKFDALRARLATLLPTPPASPPLNED